MGVRLFIKMGWDKDIYHYSVGVLKAIAEWYDTIWEVLMIGDYQITDKFGIALYRADFDRALNEIGRGKWDGYINPDFRHYKGFGRLQRVIVADILGMADRELEGLGFYDVEKLRGMAYYRMIECLNTCEKGKFEGMKYKPNERKIAQS